MHCILFYDVNVKRISKFHRLMSRKLFWTQNSSFEGDLCSSEMICLRNDINRLLDPKEDSVTIIWAPSAAAWQKTILGIDKGKLEMIA